MKKISVFNHITVDGFFAGSHDEIDWFQSVHDDEWKRYAEKHASLAQNTLMFGHTTYEMMKSFWPTPIAMQMDPVMAGVMNSGPKIVFSKTLSGSQEGPIWKNVRIFHDIHPEEIAKLKEKENITILGSGTVVQQLATLGLIDEYNLVVVPVILGTGKPLFKDVKRMNLKLQEARAFKNGIVLLKYTPARKR